MKRINLYVAIYALILVSCYKGHGLSPTAQGSDISGIIGRITFTGTWPDSTKEVRIAVLKRYPRGMTDPDSILSFVITNLAAFSDTIPRYIDQYDYQLTLEPDLYAWILVVWFPDIPVYLLGVRELGAYYKDQIQTELPTPVNVIPGLMTEGIDIIADFANLNRETPFFRTRGGHEQKNHP